ncbi:MAG TPA: hypothetical protein VEL02_06630 [Jatrophihabitantaceae bacterium]|nr:hypothetical protein [Jatrophihabitantaceae bacterium]
MGARLVGHAERGPHEGRKSLDVRAHDQDVAWFERGVVAQQPEDRLAHDFHLPEAAVARVDDQAAIVRVEFDTLRCDGVVREFILQPAEQRARPGRHRVVNRVDVRQELLQFADVARQRGEQRVAHQNRTAVILPTARAGLTGGNGIPQRG